MFIAKKEEMFITLRVQPAGARVGPSLSPALRSVNTTLKRRLFGNILSSFSRHP